MRTIPHLRLVPGGRPDRASVHGVEVRIGGTRDKDLAGITVVHEEDTHLVLSAPSVVHEIETNPIRTMHAVWNDHGRPVGSIVERPGALLAIVHDLAAEPTTRPAWIRTAVRRALEHADSRGLRRLIFQPLGSVHGRLPIGSAVTLILDALDRTPTRLRMVAILADSAHDTEARAALGLWLANQASRE